MARLVFILISLLALLAIIVTLVRVIAMVADTTKEAPVPGIVKKMSYVLLIVLMFGVVTGWLGGL